MDQAINGSLVVNIWEQNTMSYNKIISEKETQNLKVLDQHLSRQLYIPNMAGDLILS